MAELREIVAYFIANYPFKSELSNARVTKMVYLADWKSALDHGHQVSPVEWYFDNFGPFVWDILDLTKNQPDLFAVSASENYYGSPKRMLSLVVPTYAAQLHPSEQAILDFVISTTQHLSFDQFIKLVYSTYPIVSSAKYRNLDLVARAQEYRERFGAPTPVAAPHLLGGVAAIVYAQTAAQALRDAVGSLRARDQAPTPTQPSESAGGRLGSQREQD